MGNQLISPEESIKFNDNGTLLANYIKDFYYKIDLEPMVDFKTIKYCTLTNIEKIEEF